MGLTRRGAILGGLALAAVPRVATAGVAVAEGRAFGSTWRLVCGGAVPEAAREVIAARVEAIDVMMSPYRTESDLSRFNRAAPGAWVAAPEPLVTVTRHALGVAEATGGAFDPTTGPLVHRYGFGPITGERAGPEMIEAGPLRIAKTQAGATLDLCGIAKGYALDSLIADLGALGAADVLVELGGEVRALGTHPLGRPWQVAIEDPLAERLAARHVVRPGGLALATSGLTANGVIGPVSVSHVIDPRTARPAQPYAASVSVLAETGMLADALATALLAMGEDGPGFAAGAGIAALFIPATGGESRMTGGFAEFVVA